MSNKMYSSRFARAAGLTAIAVLCAVAPANAAAPVTQYTTSADTVEDNRTGLVWQRVAPTATYRWKEALEYCEALALAGFSDWRLPSVKELMTIVDVKAYEPAIDRVAFTNMPPVEYSWFFWSSSAWPRTTTYAWDVSFSDGQAYASTTSSKQHVRCVR